jgi:hypothetical protein
MDHFQGVTKMVPTNEDSSAVAEDYSVTEPYLFGDVNKMVGEECDAINQRASEALEEEAKE